MALDIMTEGTLKRVLEKHSYRTHIWRLSLVLTPELLQFPDGTVYRKL